ncbi:Hypothetical protein A7982_02098 [Minicystis rosea]|nr:Hypothetical protein A7982_02098 [Minicystis rosea]
MALPIISAPTSTLQIQSTGKCVDVSGASAANGASIIQSPCAGGANQAFSFVRQDTGVVIHTAGGKCLDVSGGSTANGAPVIQWTCHGGPNQVFEPVPSGVAGVYQLKAKHSGKCLDVTGSSTADGAQIVQTDCSTSSSQKLLVPDCVVRERLLVVVAHNDDDLIFMDPILSHALDAGTCLRAVYVAGGFRNGDRFAERERGDEESYAFLANVSNTWDQSTSTFAGKAVLTKALHDKPNVTVAYLRAMPDWQTGDSGPSLMNLWEGTEPSLASYVSPGASYTKVELTATLAAIMSDFNPTEIHTLNPDTLACSGASSYCSEHPDHIYTARFAREAASSVWPSGAAAPPMVHYHQTYTTSQRAVNIGSFDLYRKIEALTRYFQGEAGPPNPPYEGVYSTEFGWSQLREYHTSYPADAPPATTPYLQPFKLHNVWTGKCALPEDASDGAGVVLSGCDDDDVLHWVLTPWGGVRNVGTGKCLQASGDVVLQQPCDSADPHQYWSKTASGLETTNPTHDATPVPLGISDPWTGGALVVRGDVPAPQRAFFDQELHFGSDIHAELPLMGDFDGDGSSDLLILDRQQYHTYGAVPGGPGAALRVLAPSTGVDKWSPTALNGSLSSNALLAFNLIRPLVGDFDGDGKSDVMLAVRHLSDPSFDLWFYRSTGAGFAAPVLWSSPTTFTHDETKLTVGDFDGDGKADVAALSKLASGGTFDVRVFKSTGVSFAAPALWYTDATYAFADVRLDAGRFTGDTKSDLLLVTRQATSDLSVLVSTGTSFAAPTLWSHLYGFVYDWMRVKVGDVDGDGLSDVVIAHKHGVDGGFNLWAVRSEGSSFAYRELWQNFESSFYYTHMLMSVGDTNGDGLSDVVVVQRELGSFSYPSEGGLGNAAAVYIAPNNDGWFGVPAGSGGIIPAYVIGSASYAYDNGVWYMP